MAQVSIVQFSKIDIRDRIDGEYYIKEFIEIEEIIKSQKHTQLSKIAKLDASAFYPAATHLYEKGDIPFVRCVDCIHYPLLVKSGLDKFEKIPDEFLQEHGKFIKTVSDSDIVITKVGSPCFASVVHNVGKIALSRTVLGVKDIKIDPYYLMVFLRSYYGFNQLLRERELTIQYQLTLHRTGRIYVPLLSENFQKTIRKIVEEHYELKNKSVTYYQEAQQILLEALSLKDYTPKHKLSFEANLNEALSSKRIDSEYYQPKYKIVEEKIKNVKHEILGKLFNFTKGFEVGGDAYQEEGVPYLRVSNLEVLELDWSNPKFISEDLFNQLKEDFQPQKGEILLSKDGTPGIAYLVRDNVKSIQSSGILRLKLKENKKLNLSYMTLVLNSILIQQQIDRDSGGAIIKHWRPEEVKKTLVPILDDDAQEKIALKLDESYRLRKESKELLEKAKKMVEEEIEKEAKK